MLPFMKLIIERNEALSDALAEVAGELADQVAENDALARALREERSVAEQRFRGIRRMAAELFFANSRIEELEAR